MEQKTMQGATLPGGSRVELATFDIQSQGIGRCW